LAETLTTKIGLKKYAVGDLAWGPGTAGNWDAVEDLYKQGSGDPNGTVKSDFIGQLYIRTGAENDVYRATNAAAAGSATWISLRHDPVAFLKAVSGSYVTLTPSSGSVTPDFSASNFFKTTLTGNLTINNPTNAPTAGNFVLCITQDASTPYTIAWGNNYIFPSAVAADAPVLGETWFYLCEVMPDGKIRVLGDAGYEVAQSREGTYGENDCINADGSVWQYGPTISSVTPVAGSNNDGSYGPDQWIILGEVDNAVVATKETTNVPTGCATAIKLTGQGISNKFGIFQPIENLVTKRYAGGKASFQFQARQFGSGFFTKIRAAILVWTGTADAITRDPIVTWAAEDTNPSSLAANWAWAAQPTSTIILTTSYVKFKFENISIPSNATNLGIFIWGEDKSYGAGSDGFYVGRVGINRGISCGRLPPQDINSELPKCQRFLTKTHALEQPPINRNGIGDDFVGSFQAIGIQNLPGQISARWQFPVIMRATPTVSALCPANGGAAGKWRDTVTPGNADAAPVEVTRTSARITGSEGTINSRPYQIQALADARL
jgi:hypothetical protein